MTKSKIVILVCVFVLSAAAGVALFSSRSVVSLSGDWSELDWRGLSDLDYVTGEAPPKLKAMDQKNVKIPGFMVPLEDSQKRVAEFLLVPSPQACIHVPAPPPNQMVHVVMEEGTETPVAYGPIWVYGQLRLQSKRSMYGESSFTLKGVRIEPYQ